VLYTEKLYAHHMCYYSYQMAVELTRLGLGKMTFYYVRKLKLFYNCNSRITADICENM